MKTPRDILNEIDTILDSGMDNIEIDNAIITCLTNWGKELCEERDQQIKAFADWLYNSIPTGEAEAMELILLLKEAYQRIGIIRNTPLPNILTKD